MPAPITGKGLSLWIRVDLSQLPVRGNMLIFIVLAGSFRPRPLPRTVFSSGHNWTLQSHLGAFVISLGNRVCPLRRRNMDRLRTGSRHSNLRRDRSRSGVPRKFPAAAATSAFQSVHVKKAKNETAFISSCGHYANRAFILSSELHRSVAAANTRQLEGRNERLPTRHCSGFGQGEEKCGSNP